ncbi:MAG: BREX system P-loop protein BrxC [Syntrophomonadaceae bacterium]|nr:BREX system P-loop protein BrxC [Syntrophomonadaceae bacterium]MDD4549958.1 BREX system P-loop protein BrxC [Syntrophomonadaceae bacterium]
MKIAELFKKDIKRNIKGVIKVEQREENEIHQELDEYVVTNELFKHFHSFYDAYLPSLDGATDEMGVWISGFFGSGKSHFLKILSYILEGKVVKGKKAVDYFDDKIDDPLLLAGMKRAAQIPSDVILFNIDSKSDADSKVKKDAIVKVFMKVFDQKQGFCGEIPWLAEMERQLLKSGSYEKFQAEFVSIAGDEWQKLREQSYFIRDDIIAALVVSTGMTEESAAAWFDNAESNYRLSIEKFAHMVKEYCESKGPKQRIIFMVDEMGQYVGDNTDLMLNLQTVTEDLGIHSKGKAWVMVTSQQDIDGLTKNRVKGSDFSKIQGRFKTRLSLSSANTDEVIKRRILEKKDNEGVPDTLRLYYTENQAGLRNLINFSAGTAEMKSYQNEKDFQECYPFIPYQFNLLQKVFENIRKLGASGKHLSEGERSMLNAFQEAAVAAGDFPLGTLVSFNLFYNTVEKFLDHTISRTIRQAAENSHLQPYDIEILKVLFMIRHIKEIAPNLENLTTLMVSKIDEDKITLRQTIQASLDRLKAETLIQQNGDEYYFLTDEEQDINREIKSINIDERDILQEVARVVFDDIYSGQKSYKYSNYYSFGFNRQVDDINYGNQKNELTLTIMTPYADDYFSTQENLKMMTMDSSIMLMRLPEDLTFLDEIKEIKRTEKFIGRKASLNNPENIQQILDAKGREIGIRKERVKSLLETALEEAEVYGFSQRQDVKAGNAKEKINTALNILVRNEYKKLDYIKNPLTEEKQIASILRSNDTQLLGMQNDGENKEALDEIRDFIRRQDERHFRVTVKTLLDRFTIKPYGWGWYDIAGLVAWLFIQNEIRLIYNDEMMNTEDRNLSSYLCKRDEVDRLVIQLKKKVDLTLIKAAREIGRNVFGCANLPEDEDALYHKLQELIGEEIASLKAMLAEYKHGSYPGEETVKTGLKLLQELHEIRDAYSLLAAVKEQKNALLDYQEDIAPVKGFFENQVDKYNEALNFKAFYYNNEGYLGDEDIRQGIQELQNILEAAEPYSYIKDIPALLAGMKNQAEVLLEQKKSAVKASIEADQAAIEKEINKEAISPTLSQEISGSFQRLFDRLDEARDFIQLDALKAQSQDLKSSSMARIDKERAKPVPVTHKPGGNDVPVKPPQIKETQQVRLIEIARNKTILENEADVDEYLQSVKKELLQVLQDNKRIRLM